MSPFVRFERCCPGFKGDEDYCCWGHTDDCWTKTALPKCLKCLGFSEQRAQRWVCSQCKTVEDLVVCSWDDDWVTDRSDPDLEARSIARTNLRALRWWAWFQRQRGVEPNDSYMSKWFHLFFEDDLLSRFVAYDQQRLHESFEREIHVIEPPMLKATLRGWHLWELRCRDFLHQLRGEMGLPLSYVIWGGAPDDKNTGDNHIDFGQWTVDEALEKNAFWGDESWSYYAGMDIDPSYPWIERDSRRAYLLLLPYIQEEAIPTGCDGQAHKLFYALRHDAWNACWNRNRTRERDDRPPASIFLNVPQEHWEMLIDSLYKWERNMARVEAENTPSGTTRLLPLEDPEFLQVLKKGGKHCSRWSVDIYSDVWHGGNVPDASIESDDSSTTGCSLFDSWFDTDED